MMGIINIKGNNNIIGNNNKIINPNHNNKKQPTKKPALFNDTFNLIIALFAIVSKIKDITEWYSFLSHLLNIIKRL